MPLQKQGLAKTYKPTICLYTILIPYVYIVHFLISSDPHKDIFLLDLALYLICNQNNYM
uniref:Uncharacterized protein n=1 Tax=Anguilla anguilla TaxID=7936 RepID=A0A0E9V547_ANGAN